MNFQYEKWKNRDRNTEIDNMTDQKKEIAELLSGMIDGLETGDIESMIEIPPAVSYTHLRYASDQ